VGGAGWDGGVGQQGCQDGQGMTSADKCNEEEVTDSGFTVCWDTALETSPRELRIRFIFLTT
jgi:hypothetical protein